MNVLSPGKSLWVPLAAVLLLSLSGCRSNPSSNEPIIVSSPTGLHIAKIQLSNDANAQNVTTNFQPSDHTIYLKVSLSGPGNGAKVRTVWTEVDGGDTPNKVFTDKEVVVSGEGNTLNLNTSYDGDWPTGNYKVEVYLNGQLAQILNYTIG